MSDRRHGKLERQRRIGGDQILLFELVEELGLLIGRAAVLRYDLVHFDFGFSRSPISSP